MVTFCFSTSRRCHVGQFHIVWVSRSKLTVHTLDPSALLCWFGSRVQNFCTLWVQSSTHWHINLIVRFILLMERQAVINSKYHLRIHVSNILFMFETGSKVSILLNTKEKTSSRTNYTNQRMTHVSRTMTSTHTCIPTEVSYFERMGHSWDQRVMETVRVYWTFWRRWRVARSRDVTSRCSQRQGKRRVSWIPTIKVQTVSW